MSQMGQGVEAILTTTREGAREAHAHSMAKAATTRVQQVGRLLCG